MNRQLKNKITRIVVIGLAAPAFFLPAGSLLYIMAKGIIAWDWQLLSGNSGETGFGIMESIWPQITGSLLLAGGAVLIAAPISLGIALYLAMLARSGGRSFLLGLMHMLAGIPPIVYGLCALIALVQTLHFGVSIATGWVTLAVIIVPLLTLNTLHAIERIPPDQTENGRSLGLSDSAVIWRVWWPTAWPEIMTGLLLGMARALSETAPILFTATIFSGIDWPDSIFSPVTTLQTHIFYLAQEGADPTATDVAWASALVLTSMVTLISLGGVSLRRYGMRR